MKQLAPPWTLKRLWLFAAFAGLFTLVLAGPVRAQDRTILFSPTDPGVTRSITNWGLDTCWANSDNMQRGLIFMGTNKVTIIRVGFTVDSPLTNNDVSPGDKSVLQTCANLASMATAATRWDLNLDSSVNSWYQSGANTVYPDRWAAAMEACQRYYNRSIWSAEGFNEPDYTPNGEGSAQNLYGIFGYLRTSTNFPGTAMEGGSTLNDDDAVSWFNPIAAQASIGSTHCLAGSASSYVTFMQTVLSSNALPFNPEMHNVVEAIMGANYGLYGGIWWGTAELTRGSFVNACQGKQLGYADDWPNWTAAAVYRRTNGAVQAFLGGSERMAVTTTYRFFSRDRDVFYDGYGPQRDYTVTVLGGNGYQVNQPDAERVVNITWGADVQPPIGGRYVVVNRNNGLVLQVPNASTNAGQALSVGTYTGASNQLWDIYPIAANTSGDLSYYTMAAAHDGLTANEANYSYNNGNQIIQWGIGADVVEHWFFQYAGNGCFYIRSRWSDKCMYVSIVSVEQWDYLNSLSEQWRLILVSNIVANGKAISFVVPSAPAGLTATAHAVSIQLNWTASSGLTYNVLRSTNSGGPYDIVARGLADNVFTDKEANQPQTYYYVVAAVDGALNQSPYSTEVSAAPALGPTLVANYNFEGNTLDSSGNGNNAEPVGLPGYAPGIYGMALSLNGSGQYAMAPAGVMASVTNFTIAAWVNWNGGAAWQRIFDFGNNTTQYMFLTPDSASGTLRFAISTNGNAPGAEQIIETSPLPVSQWQHVAVTRNGNTAYLYTNGVLAASGSATISPADFNPALNNFGASQYPADPYFNGLLDSVYIYNYALSDAQIAQLMNNQPPPLMLTTISTIINGNMMSLSWPANYIGYRLESNSISLIATNSWFTVSGSALTNQILIPVTMSNTNVFFRLVYP
jgi:hypothetical protein